MVIDRLGEFAPGNLPGDALTATAVLSNILDFGAGGRNMAAGEKLFVNLHVLVAADGTTGDETYRFDIETDSAESFASPVVIGSMTVPRGTVAGTKFTHGLSTSVERFLRVKATLGGTTPSITVKSWLARELPSNWSALADAI